VAARGRPGPAPNGAPAGRELVLARLLDPRVLRTISYTHSVVYLVLLWAAFVDRHDRIVTLSGWSHGLLWIGMSLLCLQAVRRRLIPLWLGVVVAVVGGIGPFAGSVGFAVEKRRVDARRERADPAMLG
jgi:hypothetical protein